MRGALEASSYTWSSSHACEQAGISLFSPCGREQVWRSADEVVMLQLMMMLRAKK